MREIITIQVSKFLRDELAKKNRANALGNVRAAICKLCAQCSFQ